MTIISKIKYIAGSIFTIVFVSTSMYAEAKTSNNYAYIQINQMHNINSELREASWTQDVDNPEVLVQSNSKLNFSLFDPAFMSNLIVGFMWGGNYGVELEYASYDMFISKLNGNKAGNQEFSSSNIRIEYVFFNFRQDFWEYKDINVFYKLGYGFVQPNFGSGSGDGKTGSELEMGIQGGLGAYYAFNDFIDVEVSYKLLGNYARRRELNTYGFERKIKFVESSINWGVRFKLHSYSRKDISVY